MEFIDVHEARHLQPASLIAIARRAIRTEAKGLNALASGLGPSFADAINCIIQIKGRVILSGIGKSGHVARKIASTLASTGTPAQFVHPGEASHGDLGMITGGDIVMLISNSGETPELVDLIAYARRFRIQLIGIASNPESGMMRQCDIRLVLPAAREACPMGLAPTTSTTMAMVLGDALAVGLMSLRRFTPEKFRGFHPGGRLGARLKTVRDLMHSGRDFPSVGPETPMSETLIEMTRKGFGAVAVTDNGRLLGIITDGDLRRHMEGLLDHTAGEVMTRNPHSVTATTLASEALGQMNSAKITTLIATNPDSPDCVEGILHVHDLLRAGVA